MLNKEKILAIAEGWSRVKHPVYGDMELHDEISFARYSILLPLILSVIAWGAILDSNPMISHFVGIPISIGLFRIAVIIASVRRGTLARTKRLLELPLGTSNLELVCIEIISRCADRTDKPFGKTSNRKLLAAEPFIRSCVISALILLFNPIFLLVSLENVVKSGRKSPPLLATTFSRYADKLRSLGLKNIVPAQKKTKRTMTSAPLPVVKPVRKKSIKPRTRKVPVIV